MGNKLVKNSIIYAIGDIAPRLLSFISFPILTRYLDPTQYAIINYVNTVTLFMTAIGFLCLNTYYLVYYYKQETEEERAKLLGNLSVFVIGLNFFISSSLLLFGPKLFRLLESNIDFYPYIAIGIVTNFFGLFSILPSALFRLEERPLPLTLLNIAKGILLFATTITLIVGFGFKAEGTLYSQMVVTIIFGMIFLRITLKNMVYNINWSQIRSALVFSLPLLPGTISYLLTSMSDRILIDKYLNLSDLGIYSSASTLALILNIIAYGAYKAFEPYIFKTYGTKDFLSGFTKIRNGLFIVMAAGAFGISLFAKEFFQIFSEQQYHSAYYFVPLIIVGVLCSGISLPYGTVITATGRTRINSMISIAGGTISVLMNILLLPMIGLIGACITSASAYLIILISNIYFSHISISHIRTVFLTLIMGVMIYIFVYRISIDSLVFSILIKIGTFFITIYVSSIFMGFNPLRLKPLFNSYNCK